MRQDNFSKWLEDRTNLAQSSIKGYTGAINTVSKGLKKYNLLGGNLYDIRSSTELGALILKYFSIDEFKEKDSRGRKMYSNALRHYKQFVLDEEKINRK